MLTNISESGQNLHLAAILAAAVAVLLLGIKTCVVTWMSTHPHPGTPRRRTGTKRMPHP